MSDGSLKKFSIRMAYSELHDGGDVVRWSKLIWFSQNIPKHAFLLWLAIQCKLPTQDKIRRWGNYDLMVCLLCYSDLDSHDHLFFNCSYTSKFWAKVMHKLKMDNSNTDWEGVVGAFVDSYNGSSVGSITRRLCLAASVYLVWQERNNRLFKDERRSVDDFFKCFCDTIKMRLASLKMKWSKAVCDTEKIWDIKLNVISG
ncbi:reverse transcriptase zinc-binding domain-containing protein [Artemisia annua]|uniref:Reverse transcriptase zinc-binding domain-containing protein n=1 Tax=Artemisia annua TaxID=35608 RepID=A0A2U1M2P9_ARTAN|nr:reverse transcriptase zinc-binding domain-containing protein [Artemisia annua]